MSAHFAIPATSFVLKSLIEQQLKLAYGGFTPPVVSVAPPPRPSATAAGMDQPEAPGLIVYMHHAGPNPGWRNRSVPYTKEDGTQSIKTPLVLDLHYLLAAMGGDLEREALLGLAMVAFHRHGIVSRAKVSAILADVAVPPSPTKFMETMTREPLGDPSQHPESMTITQQPVDIDMSTKLWSALQSPIRPCAHYLVTTTMLDTDDDIALGKPVTTVRISGQENANPNADRDDNDVIVHTKPPS